MAKTHTGFRIRPEVLEQLDARGPRSTIADRDLERLYALYARALQRVVPSFSIDELCLIVDALNGTLHDVRSGVRFWIGVEDSIELDGLAQKWNVDALALMEKLRPLDELTCMAIVDAAERFWCGEKYRNMDVHEGVRDAFGIRNT